jgi:hypothetical protein
MCVIRKNLEGDWIFYQPSMDAFDKKSPGLRGRPGRLYCISPVTSFFQLISHYFEAYQQNIWRTYLEFITRKWIIGIQLLVDDG